MNCANAIDLMGDAIDGRLAAEIREDFDEHIEACSPCGVYYEQLRLTRKALELLRAQGDTSPRRTELIERFRREFREKTPEEGDV